MQIEAYGFNGKLAGADSAFARLPASRLFAFVGELVQSGGSANSARQTRRGHALSSPNLNSRRTPRTVPKAFFRPDHTTICRQSSHPCHSRHMLVNKIT